MSTNAVMDTTVTGRRRNRSWPEELKWEIVAASFEPGASVSVVARRYDVNTNHLFSWRKLHRDGLLGSGGPALVPVTVADARDAGNGSRGVTDTIEIEVPGGYRVRVGSGVDGAALRRMLEVPARRCSRSERGTCLAGGGAHGHASRHEQPGAAGAAGARARPACRRFVCFQGRQRRPDQDPLA